VEMTDPAASLASLQQPERHSNSRPANAQRSLPRVLATLGFARNSESRIRQLAREYLTALAIAGACTAVAYPLYPRLGPVNTVMLYLLGTTLGALRLSRGPCVVLPVANILAFDFFFVPPTFSFDVEDAQYIFTLVVMLIVALVIAHLMLSIRRHRDLTLARERRTAVLYAMSRELIVATDATAMAATVVRHLNAVFHSSTVVLIADSQGELRPAFRDGNSVDRLPESRVDYDAAFAREVAERGERCIQGAIYLPLQGSRGIMGVIVVQSQHAGPLPTEQLNLLDAFAAQLAMSLQRAQVAEEAEIAKIEAERVLLRNTLLASISHDLRTPLAAIAGAGSLIGQPDYAINAERRAMLGNLIERKATDMSQLLSNVLDLAKMELGQGALRAEWHAVEDLVSHALRANQARLTGWRVVVDLPANFPSVFVEATLIVQMLSNLLENAAKYTPPGTTISIAAAVREEKFLLVVADDGPGLPGDPESLFEKFQRGNPEGNVVGVGLGLAICRAAARLHGGDIRALRQPDAGARFEITLPVKMQTEQPSAAETESA
jgi:two-component system, OmpR family, sensor histidine kinase KdpD